MAYIFQKSDKSSHDLALYEIFYSNQNKWGDNGIPCCIASALTNLIVNIVSFKYDVLPFAIYAMPWEKCWYIMLHNYCVLPENGCGTYIH